MRYCDLHCDTLTTTNNKIVTAKRLQEGACFLQCFAVFLSDSNGAFEQTKEWCRYFYEYCCKNNLLPIRNGRAFSDGIHALLTVEGGEAIEGSLQKLDALYELGVRMMTLTWNRINQIGYPNILTDGKHVMRRNVERGLTDFGICAVERMKELGMIVDVSHGSDKLFWMVKDILKSVPFVASHSNADSVFRHARNLTDAQIRAVADSGGVIGLNFCMDFLSNDHSAEGQRAALLAHAKTIYRMGGEDVLAIGSDFDGTCPNAFVSSPAEMGKVVSLFERAFGMRVAEKIAYRNVIELLHRESFCR